MTDATYYTRAQAIANGTLIDVSQAAEEAGFKIPIVVTASVWQQFIEWSEKDSKQQVLQESNQRLSQVLSMLHFAMLKKHNPDCILYKLYVVPLDGKSKKARLIQLKAALSIDEAGFPVITIMLPNEN